MKHIPNLTKLRLNIYALFAVKKRIAVQLDMTAVRTLYAGDALEGHGFAAAGGAEQARHALLCLKGRPQRKAAKLLFYIHDKAHIFALPFFFSSIFTANSTAADMARFISTHIRALLSSLVRQY